MKTEKTTITDTVYVFAEAKSEYQLENLEPGELPFNYTVKSYDLGSESSVRIMEAPVTLVIPDGIDLTLECIKNLEEKIEVIQKKADKEIQDIRDRIRNLALIEYKPVPEPEDSSDSA